MKCSLDGCMINVIQASMTKSFSNNSNGKDIAGHHIATRLCGLHVMHACRFVVCLAFVFGGVRTVYVNMWIVAEAAGMELWTMVDLLKADRRLGLLVKNYVYR